MLACIYRSFFLFRLSHPTRAEFACVSDSKQQEKKTAAYRKIWLENDGQMLGYYVTTDKLWKTIIYYYHYSIFP